MKIVIAGASGLVGTALVPALRAAGHEVYRLVRRAARSSDEIAWSPAEGKMDEVRFSGAEAVINLAGENVGAGRWTARRRELILRSRVDATRALVEAMGRMKRKPAVLLNASAVGFYGDRGAEVLTEASASGRGFLPDVCRVWESGAAAASAIGVRVTWLRFGVVLAAEGGALAKMLPLFRLGLGGRLGSGQQWMNWVGLADAVAAICHALQDTRLVGAVNVVVSESVRNIEFIIKLGRVLRRPVVLPVPAWALRLALGQMADEALLASSRAVPERLLKTGFQFRHPTLESALHAVLSREKL